VIISNELKLDCMKYLFRSLAVLIFLLAATAPSLYAKKTEVRLLLKKGQKFEYVVSGLLRAEKELGDKPMVIEQKIGTDHRSGRAGQTSERELFDSGRL